MDCAKLEWTEPVKRVWLPRHWRWYSDLQTKGYKFTPQYRNLIAYACELEEQSLSSSVRLPEW